MEDNSITQMLVSGQNDLMWFESNLSSLISKYNNQFIAFHDKIVIASDSSINSLMAKLNKKEIDTSNVLIRFVSKVKLIL